MQSPWRLVRPLAPAAARAATGTGPGAELFCRLARLPLDAVETLETYLSVTAGNVSRATCSAGIESVPTTEQRQD